MKKQLKRGRPAMLEEPRNITVAMRVNKSEYNRIKALWPTYTKEGVSDYLRMCVFSYKKVGSKRGATR